MRIENFDIYYKKSFLTDKKKYSTEMRLSLHFLRKEQMVNIGMRKFGRKSPKQNIQNKKKSQNLVSNNINRVWEWKQNVEFRISFMQNVCYYGSLKNICLINFLSIHLLELTQTCFLCSRLCIRKFSSKRLPVSNYSFPCLFQKT